MQKKYIVLQGYQIVGEITAASPKEAAEIFAEDPENEIGVLCRIGIAEKIDEFEVVSSKKVLKSVLKSILNKSKNCKAHS